jgi:TatD DNase family protein
MSQRPLAALPTDHGPKSKNAGCAALMDTHAHLDDDRFQNDLPAVLERAEKAGVSPIITIGTTCAASTLCVALAGKHRTLYASVGIQPNHITAEPGGAWDEIVRLVSQPRVVAVGETGLDRHWHDTPFDQQEDYFARHLDLARRHRLAVVIHCREAETDTVRMLRDAFDRHGPVRGVMHSFTGDAPTAQACLSMGLHLSFAGMVTYKNAQALRQVAADVPLERLLVETDSPYLAPVPVRGQRNEPAHVVHTAACLAGVLSVAPAVVAELTTRNARALFGLGESGASAP